MAVEVFAADEQDEAPVDAARWVRLAERVLEAEGMRGDTELSMLFVDEVSMADLNKRFRGEEGATDVLAFPIDEDAVEGGRSPDSGGPGPGVSASELSGAAPGAANDASTRIGRALIGVFMSLCSSATLKALL